MMATITKKIEVNGSSVDLIPIDDPNMVYFSAESGEDVDYKFILAK